MHGLATKKRSRTVNAFLFGRMALLGFERCDRLLERRYT